MGLGSGAWPSRARRSALDAAQRAFKRAMETSAGPGEMTAGATGKGSRAAAKGPAPKGRVPQAEGQAASEGSKTAQRTFLGDVAAAVVLAVPPGLSALAAVANGCQFPPSALRRPAPAIMLVPFSTSASQATLRQRLAPPQYAATPNTFLPQPWQEGKAEGPDQTTAPSPERHSARRPPLQQAKTPKEVHPAEFTGKALASVYREAQEKDCENGLRPRGARDAEMASATTSGSFSSAGHSVGAQRHRPSTAPQLTGHRGPAQTQPQPARGLAAAQAGLGLQKGLQASTSAQQVASLVLSNQSALTDVNVATALGRMLSLQRREPPQASGIGPVQAACRSLKDHVKANASAYGPRALANSAYFLSELGAVTPNVLESVSSSVLERPSDVFSARQLADLAWAYRTDPKGDVLPAVVRAILTMESADIGPKALTNLSRALASSPCPSAWGPGHQKLLEHLAAAVPPCLAQLSPRELAALAWSFSSLHQQQHDPNEVEPSADGGQGGQQPGAVFPGGGPLAGALEILAASVAERADHLGARDLVTAAQALSMAKLSSPQVFDSVATAILPHVPRMSPWSLANLASTFSTPGASNASRSVAVMDAVARSARSCLPGCTPQGLAVLSSAFSHGMSTHTRGLLQAVTAEACRRGLGCFNPQELCLLASSLARAQVPNPIFFQTLEARVLPLLDGLNAQGLSNLAWAFASSGRMTPTMTAALTESASARLDDFPGPSLSILSWAMAEATPSACRDLLTQVAARVKAGTVKLGPQDVSNLCWAFASARHPDTEAFGCLAAVAAPLLPSCTPQHLSNLTWAFARVQLPAPDLLDAVLDEALPRLHEFSSQGLANMAWGFGTLMHDRTPELLKAIEPLASARLPHFTSPELTMTAVACASVDPGVCPGLTDVLAREAMDRMGEFKLAGLRSMAEALRTSGHPLGEILLGVCDDASRITTAKDTCQPPGLKCLVTQPVEVTGIATR